MPGEDQHSSTKALQGLARALRRHEDNARFIERFEILTGVRVQSTSVDGLPREFLGSSVESPDVLVRQHGYELEPRTHNALRQYEPGRHQDSWTFGRLLQIRGFGVFSLLDLLEVLAKHGIRPTGTD